MDVINNRSAAEDIEIIRSKMRMIMEDKEIAGVLGSDFIEELKGLDAIVEKRSSEPFTLVILGEFKRGKSTIINALLGKELAPSNVSPETYTINEISYGPIPKVEAVLENGDRRPLTFRDITRDRLKVKMRLYPSKIAYLDIKDNADILKELRIVDTPGLSDLEDLDKQVTEYLVNADAIMYATSSLLPFSETEQIYLASHIQPQRFGILYILVNMMDALQNRTDVDKIMRRFKSISGRIVPNAIVYGISGADEFARKTEGKRPPDKGTRDFYETQFLQFELSLKRDMIMQKDVIRTKRVLTMVENMVGETYQKLRMLSDMAEMDMRAIDNKTAEFDEQCEQLAQAIEDAKPKLHLSITEMQQEAEKWMYEFFAKLRQSMLECRGKNENGEDLFDPDDIEKYFYSYLMEKVGEAYRTCIEHHRRRIDRFIEDVTRDLSHKLGIREIEGGKQSADTGRLMRSMNTNVTRSVMSVKLFGTSETFPPATMSTFSLILKKKKQTDVIDIALENYDEIRINIVSDIKNVYKDLEAKTIQQLEEIYHHQTDAGRDAINQAKQVFVSLDEKTVTDALARADGLIGECIDILENYPD
ncbi:Dynamin family protein [Ruminococcaceae bacterium FB2012]|nr:Dynamin family protein [Ruminococcaceae bacterium FB2012]